MEVHKIKLEFYKPRGKWYSGAEFTMEFEDDVALFKIWEAIDAMRVARDGRTGLTSGGTGFYCTIDVPTHKHSHPHMLLPKESKPDAAITVKGFAAIVGQMLATHALMEGGSQPPIERDIIRRRITTIKLVVQDIITADDETPQQVIDRNQLRLHSALNE